MKIYCDVSVQYKRFHNLLDCSIKNNLIDDIEFTNNIKDCDLIIILFNSGKSLMNVNSIKKPPQKKIDANTKIEIIKSVEFDNIQKESYFSYNKPIIVLERLDSAITWVRNIKNYPNIIAVFKNRIVYNNKYNTKNLFSGRYHGKLITDGLIKENINLVPVSNKSQKKKDLASLYFPEFKVLDNITDNEFKKYKAVLWDFLSSPVSRKMKFFKYNTDFTKTHDVFCVHTIRPGIIGEHRKKAINIIKNMKHIKSFTDKCSNDVYNKNFVKCKICVACWGFGEWTHMDGYAFYSKVILIKPDTSYVKMDPELYVKERYIPCKPDFSDLEDIINNILKNYDYYEKLLESNYEYIRSKDDKYYAKKFWDTVKEEYNNYLKNNQLDTI